MNISYLAYGIYFIIYSVIHLVIDIFYLKFTKGIYTKHVARIQGKEVENLKPFRVWPAGIFAYGIILLSFWVFVLHDIINGLEKRKWVIFIKSTLIALCIWGMYNLTNYISLERYKENIVYMDISWGIISCNVIAFVFFYLVEYFSRVGESVQNTK